METLPDFAGLHRIPDSELPLRDIRYLALVRVDLIALYRRWGRPDVGLDCLAEWLSFAFALPGGGVFALQREACHPPTPGFLLSANQVLFSADAAQRLVEALDIPEAVLIEVSPEVAH